MRTDTGVQNLSMGVNPRSQLSEIGDFSKIGSLGNCNELIQFYFITFVANLKYYTDNEVQELSL